MTTIFGFQALGREHRYTKEGIICSRYAIERSTKALTGNLNIHSDGDGRARR